jgi:hypothetical protein
MVCFAKGRGVSGEDSRRGDSRELSVACDSISLSVATEGTLTVAGNVVRAFLIRIRSSLLPPNHFVATNDKLSECQRDNVPVRYACSVEHKFNFVNVVGS